MDDTEKGLRMARVMAATHQMTRDLVRIDSELTRRPDAPDETVRLHADMMLHAKGLLAALDAISEHFRPRADA